MIADLSDLPDFGKLTSREPPLAEAVSVESWIVRETDDFLVLDKPGWLVCHPSKNGPWSSLVGAVRELRGIDRLHLVSRLDRETSGLVILAKHKQAASRFQVAIQERRAEKRYLAILEGELTEAVRVSQPLSPDRKSPVHVKQQAGRRRGARTAKTIFHPQAVKGGYSLVEVEPLTGRKHQIRVHAQHLGFPIVGDKLYGRNELLYLQFIAEGWTPALAELLSHPRHALHAARLRIWGDGWEESFAAPLAIDLDRFWKGVAA